MQTAEAHPSLRYHHHPHEAGGFPFEDALLLAAVLTLFWVLRPFRLKGKKS